MTQVRNCTVYAYPCVRVRRFLPSSGTELSALVSALVEAIQMLLLLPASCESDERLKLVADVDGLITRCFYAAGGS